MREVINALLLNLAGSFLWFLLGALSLFGYWLGYQVYPARRLWRLKGREPAICVSTSGQTDTGSYIRPVTGVGQLRALVLVIESLRRAYRKMDVRRVSLSEETLGHRLDGDLILLGGPNSNKLTRATLDKLGDRIPVRFDGNNVVWQREDGGEDVWVPEKKDKRVTRDYGVAIRARNPFSTDSGVVCLFAGAHTYGGIAAARYFTERLYRRAHWPVRMGPNLVAVVACDVVDGDAVNVRMVRQAVYR